MIQLGYALSSEEHSAQSLIENAVKAEAAGFSFALISDHFHPWLDQQGQSPFVWSVLGAISQRTKTLRLGTGVTCPILRIHPAIIAQAAATTAALLEGRFFLGLGTGENLNEHIVGLGWPPIDQRQEMLEEAVEIIRMLWEGGMKSYYGNYFTVENAQIYSLPKELPELYLAASGSRSAALAGNIGDGFISTSPDTEVVQAFEEAGGMGKPTYGQLSVCIGKTEEEGITTAHTWWPNTALPGQLSQEMRLPSYFEQASTLVTKEQIAQQVICSLDPKAHLAKIQAYADAGFDHIYIHQIGPDQEAFFTFYEKEILPRLSSIKSNASSRYSKPQEGRRIKVTL